MAANTHNVNEVRQEIRRILFKRNFSYSPSLLLEKLLYAISMLKM